MNRSIAILDDIHLLPEAQKQINSLAGYSLPFPKDNLFTGGELIARTQSAEAVLISPDVTIDSNYLDACPSVKYVGLCGTSLSNVDVDELSRRGITLKNVVDYGDKAAAEFIFMQLTSLARGTGDYQWHDDMPCELAGKCMGIVGLGALGKSIARLALAYGMHVNYHSLRRKLGWEGDGVNYKKLPDLLSMSEIVVISTPTDVKILGEDEFAMLRPSTVLVQASRGNTFEKSSFLQWVGKPSSYALLDYSAGEENYRAYKDLPHVIFPKITAGYTRESKERLGQKVIENLSSYFGVAHAK